MGPVGECQALCFRTLDELTMDPPGNLGSAPSVIGYGPCARPTLIMYVYKRLVSAVGIPQT